MKLNRSGDRWWIGGRGYTFGVQGAMPEWWHQWRGPGGRSAPIRGRSAFDRQYPDGMGAWVLDQANMIERCSQIVGQWTDVRLALELRKRGLWWAPVLLPNEETNAWARRGASVSEGIDLVRSAARELVERVERFGGDPATAINAVSDFQEPIWAALRFGILNADQAVDVARELFPACAEVMREELPGEPLIASPKLAGSTRKDFDEWGWIGTENDEPGGDSHRWQLLTASASGRDVLALNCYGDRSRHRLEDQYRWTGLPIMITEFSRWILDPRANRRRWAEFKIMQKSTTYPHEDSIGASVDAVERDIMHDVEGEPWVIGSMIYLWSYHAWNWGRSKRHRAMGYLGHAVDPTITDRKTYRETRNIGWIDGVGRAVERADKRGKELRP